MPLALNGKDELSNLALSCRSCNLYKAISVTATDPETRASVALFHPRHDKWQEHFRLQEEAGIIEGLTSKGRATVVALRMNGERQVAARLQWLRLGIYS